MSIEVLSEGMRLEGGVTSGKPVGDYELVAVYSGAAPRHGVVQDGVRPVWWTGGDDSAQAAADAAKGRIGLLDEILVLDSASHEPGWMLMRRRRILPTGGVLIVEDNEVNREFYEEVVAQIGLEVHTAGNAHDALEIARNNVLSLGLIDVRLPDANGFELCRSLGSIARDPDFTLLLMSADPNLADRERVEAVGARGFIVNPISPVKLAQEVVTAIEQPEPIHIDVVDTSPPEEAEAAQVQLSFFGRPSIEVDDSSTPLRAGQSTVLLATLASACPAPVSSERLARYGWPSEADVSTNAVYTAVSRLRQFLQTVGAEDLLISDGSGYTLDLEPDAIDLIRFETSARKLLAVSDLEPAAALEEIREVLDVWTGEPFLGARNEVLARWANRLTETRSRLLETQAVLLVMSGSPGPAAEVCRDLLLEEPWREFMWATLIVALYRQGRTRDALAAFGHARTQLQEELGLDPGPLLTDLEVMILTHDPALRDDEWLQRAAAGSPVSGVEH